MRLPWMRPATTCPLCGQTHTAIVRQHEAQHLVDLSETFRAETEAIKIQGQEIIGQLRAVLLSAQTLVEQAATVVASNEEHPDASNWDPEVDDVDTD